MNPAWDFTRQHWRELAMGGVMALLCLKIMFSTVRMLVRAAWHVPKAVREGGIGTSGSASTEFIIVMPIMFLVLATIAQKALIAEARIVVAHAAYKAARAAMVIVPEPSDLEGPGEVGFNTGLITDFAVSNNWPSGKVSLVRQAAASATLTVSPNLTQWAIELAGETDSQSLRTNFERSYGGTTGLPGIAGFAAPIQKMLYANAFTSVVFTGGPSCSDRLGSLAAGATASLGGFVSGQVGSTVGNVTGNLIGQYNYLCSYVTHFDRGAQIQARVIYLMYVSVPVASRFAGSRYDQIDERVRIELGTSIGGGITGIGEAANLFRTRGFYLPIVATHSMPAQDLPQPQG
jgi:hypothetical protein